VAIAVALSFDSGIVLCADATHGVPACAKIFPKHYHSLPDGARSIFLISEPIDDTVAACRQCEHGLDALQPTEFTIDRMRATIERSLLEMSREHLDSSRESTGETTLLVALYSASERQCSLFRASGPVLRELVGYDCQGPAAHLGHYLIRDRYRAAQSMDALDLTTAFSIAIETLQSVRECPGGCGESTEIMVMYANGRASDVQHIRRATQKQRKLALSALSGA
jgi:hypothetical protein